MDDRRRDALIKLINEVREVLGVSSERQLAKLLGVTSTDLKRWTKERVGRPYPEFYEKIADILGLSMDELYVRLGRKSNYVHFSVDQLVKQVSSLDSLEATQQVAMHAIARMGKLASESRPQTHPSRKLAIASSPVGRYRVSNKGVKNIVNPIIQLLSAIIAENNLDIETVSEETGIPPERLVGLLDGSIPVTEDDVVFLAAWEGFVKEDGTQWEYEELYAIWREIPYEPSHSSDTSDDEHSNGYCHQHH